MPKKVKHRKMFRGGEIRGLARRGQNMSFGSFGLKSMESGLISSRQIESARRAMTRYVQRGGKIWIRLFPHKPMTKKGAEVPMGKGKGAVDHYVAKIRAGRVMFEMDGVDIKVAREAMRRAAQKLSVKAKFVRRDEE